MGIEITIQPEIVKGLKDELKLKAKDVVRFEVVDFGWGGPIFDIVLDEQKEDDTLVEIDGLKFVADSEIAALLKNPEIVKEEEQFTVKKSGCCG